MSPRKALRIEQQTLGDDFIDPAVLEKRCSAIGCVTPSRKHGLCLHHWYMSSKYGDPNTEPAPRPRKIAPPRPCAKCGSLIYQRDGECPSQFNKRKTCGAKDCLIGLQNSVWNGHVDSKARMAIDPEFKEAHLSRKRKRSKTRYAQDDDYHQRTAGAVRASRRLKRFGKTEKELKLMFDAQGGKCAVCPVDLNWEVGRGSGPRNDRACVDHDHETKLVRGILCGRCNTGLGQFRDDPLLLEAAAAYLRRFK